LTSPSTGLAPYLREQIRMELDEILANYSKSNGDAYNIYSDGLKIHTTINSKLQTYAEEAVNEHMPWLQSQFLKEWKGKDPYKYGARANPDLIKNIVKESEPYIALAEQGKSEKEIYDILSTEKHAMRIFTWKGPRDTMMSYIDSLKYMKKILQVGLCAMDPHSGRIKAWVGGIDFNFFKLDHVRKSTKRQVGSTIKPLLYDLAIEAGETPCSTIEYTKPLIPGHEKWDPKGTKFFIDGSQVSLRDGLQVSDNRVAAQLIKKYGSQALIEKAKQLGIEAEFEDGPAICLGTTDISVIEMLGAYSPFMNSGIYSKPYYIERIEDKNGNIIYQNTPQSKEVIAEEAAKLMNIMMQQVSQDRGTASRLRKQYGFKGEIACKTGTTQSNSDGWFIGSTPSLLTAVWVGADDPSITFASTGLGQGASSALPVWGKFYQKAHKDPTNKITQLKSFFTEADSAVLQKYDCNFQPQILADPNEEIIVEPTEKNVDEE
jgi:penicillin-binding protein 1A